MRGYILLFIFLALAYTCSDREYKAPQGGESYCKAADIWAEEKDGCVYVHWRCEGGKNPEVILSRKTDYNNSALKEEYFQIKSNEYLDCSIKRGIKYTYSIISENKEVIISTNIETAPVKDFDIKIISERATGRLLEIELIYHPTTENPFDMSRLDITMKVLKPDGSDDESRGFFMTEYNIERDEGDRERFVKGEERLRVRYNPNMAGTYILYFTIRDENILLTSGYYPVEVSRYKGRDYIKVSKKNPLYFSDENEKPFFPIGFNIGWARYSGLFEFQHYIDKMKESYSNLFRMWMIKWSNAIEWTEGYGSGDYKGLMRYAQDNAARIDRILSYAEERDIKIMLTLGSYLEFTEGGSWNEGSWKENPYNIENGGMCRNSSDFFLMKEAREYYKNRLRYISARWGYSSSIFAYEFFNETYAPFEWVSEMSAFLKKIDYNRHMISTTYGDDKIFTLKNIDFTMTHLYGNPPELIKDYPQRVNEITTQHITKYKKPFLLAEFGIDWSKSDYEYDRDGTAINFHNGVFAAISSGSAGTAMLWWWDDYIDRLNLYKILSPVNVVIDELGDMSNYRPLNMDNLRYERDKLNVYGIVSDSKLLLWIQNKESNWYNEYNQIEYESVSGVISIQNLNLDCKAKIKIFDPWNGYITDNYFSNINKQYEFSFENIKRDILLIIRCDY
ncbi:MAG: hypothetical protein ACP5KG_02475 [Myxococcota bacterium]